MRHNYQFRGYSEELKEFVYGSYVTKRQCVDDKWYNHFIIAQDGKAYPIRDRETIGQFTGTFDKNGKEIYEGDVTRYDVIDQDLLGVVTYLPHYALYVVLDGEEDYSFYEIESRALEVIGNVTENLELAARVLPQPE